MSEENETLVRGAYEAYGRGDVTRLLELVHPDLEWTYLDPSFADPQPQVCHGRDQLAWALGRQADRGVNSELEGIESCGDRVMVAVHPLASTSTAHGRATTAITWCSRCARARLSRCGPSGIWTRLAASPARTGRGDEASDPARARLPQRAMVVTANVRAAR